MTAARLVCQGATVAMVEVPSGARYVSFAKKFFVWDGHWTVPLEFRESELPEAKKIPKRQLKVDLGFEYLCQKCKKNDKTTRQREIYSAVYEGPCGDSICYASCDSPACKPIHATVCDTCVKAISKPGRG